MRIDPQAQLVAAAASLVLGMAFGVVYDIFRTLRRRMHSPLVTFFTDILFCVIICAAVFLMGYTIGGGRIRVYMAVSAALGAAVYFALLSRFVLKILDLIARFVLYVAAAMVFPFKIVKNFLKKMLIFLKNFFYYNKKRYTMKWIICTSAHQKTKTDSRALRSNTNEAEKGRYYY